VIDAMSGYLEQKLKLQINRGWPALRDWEAVI
jgi:hypothetical protein